MVINKWVSQKKKKDGKKIKNVKDILMRINRINSQNIKYTW